MKGTRFLIAYASRSHHPYVLVPITHMSGTALSAIQSQDSRYPLKSLGVSAYSCLWPVDHRRGIVQGGYFLRSHPDSPGEPPYSQAYFGSIRIWPCYTRTAPQPTRFRALQFFRALFSPGNAVNTTHFFIGLSVSVRGIPPGHSLRPTAIFFQILGAGPPTHVSLSVIIMAFRGCARAVLTRLQAEGCLSGYNPGLQIPGS